MIKTLILIFLVISFSSLHGQPLSLYGEVTYSSFNMERLKDFQSEQVKNSGLPLVKQESFPNYWGYGAKFSWDFDSKSTVGICYSYTSTGSRFDYKDYSGKARLDYLIKSSSIGGFYQSILYEKKSGRIFCNIRALAIFSKLDIASSIQIGTETQSDQLETKSINLGIRPGIGYQYRLKRVTFELGIGYELQFYGKLHVPGDKKRYLVNSKNEEVTAQWDGLRIHFGCGFRLFKSVMAE